MDCVFNKKIPKSDLTRHVLRPMAKTWVNGLSSAYEAVYDPGFFQDYIERRKFIDAIEFFNEEVGSMFPCPLCFCYGYCCCICTLGMSFLFPMICVNDAKQRARQVIHKLNRQIFNPRGLRIEIEFGCSTSWLSIYKGSKAALAADDIRMYEK